MLPPRESRLNVREQRNLTLTLTLTPTPTLTLTLTLALAVTLALTLTLTRCASRGRRPSSPPPTPNPHPNLEPDQVREQRKEAIFTSSTLDFVSLSACGDLRYPDPSQRQP